MARRPHRSAASVAPSSVPAAAGTSSARWCHLRRRPAALVRALASGPAAPCDPASASCALVCLALLLWPRSQSWDPARRAKAAACAHAWRVVWHAHRPHRPSSWGCQLLPVVRSRRRPHSVAAWEQRTACTRTLGIQYVPADFKPSHLRGNFIENSTHTHNSTQSYLPKPTLSLSLYTLTAPHKITVPTSLKQLAKHSHRPIMPSAAAHAAPVARPCAASARTRRRWR